MNAIALLDCCETVYDHPMIVAGPEGRDGATVTQLPSGETVLAFRGTLANDDLPSLADWLNDMRVDLVAADGFAGRVHEGWLASLNTLWPAVFNLLEGGARPTPPTSSWWKRLYDRVLGPSWPDITSATLAPPPLPWEKKLIITGHSKGGAIAQMAGVRLQPLKPQVVTFAAPMWTDREGASGYPREVKVTLYQAKNDLVPFIPPFAYEQVLESEIVSQAFSDMPLVVTKRLSLAHADHLMADLLDRSKRHDAWITVAAAHHLENYRRWLSQMPPAGEPQGEAA